jgi:hypothetical protein
MLIWLCPGSRSPGLTPWRNGREKFDLDLKLQHDQPFAAASDDPALLEGTHAASLLVALDEAKSISAEVFDAVYNALSGPGQVFALATSTPGGPAGRFYDLCRHRPGLEDEGARHITLDDAVAAGRVSRMGSQVAAAGSGTVSAAGGASRAYRGSPDVVSALHDEMSGLRSELRSALR